MDGVVRFFTNGVETRDHQSYWFGKTRTFSGDFPTSVGSLKASLLIVNVLGINGRQYID